MKKSEDSKPKPIKLKLKRNDDLIPFSYDMIPSKDNHFEKEIKIIKNKIVKKFDNLNSANSEEILREYASKSHNY